MYDFVERWGAATPDRDALAFGDRRWTWAELDHRVRRVAGTLRDAGLGPGDRFAVLDKNHPACIELTLAGERVMAVVVAADGAVIDETAVIAFTRDRFAHYKCPTSVEEIPELPRDPLGKLLKHELRAQAQLIRASWREPVRCWR
jgi:acyl-CoA synthetase (AMP-forming)/AMP-acid ligase II